MEKQKIGIIAGSGRLPVLVIESLQKLGYEFVVVFLEEQNQELLSILAEDHYKSYPIGQVGKILKFIKESGASDILFVGKVKKPKFSELKVDLLGAKLLAKISKNQLLGDNTIFKTIFSFLSKEGFRVVGTQDLKLPLHIAKGVYGQKKIDDSVISDIKIATKLLSDLSSYDVGQSIVIQSGRIIGIEAAEGTDGLIKRSSDFLDKKAKHPAILVKSSKKGQELKIDLPTIGIDTIRNLIANGYGGLAIEAQNTIVLDQEEIESLSKSKKFFIYAY